MAEKLKRWWVFAGDTYYPCGGMGDFRGSFDTEKDAELFVKKELGSHGWHHVDWHHVVDTQGEEINPEDYL